MLNFESELPHSHVVTNDFDELASAMLSWNVDLRQLGRGRFAGEFELVSTGSVIFYRVAANLPLLAQGTPPPGTRVFSIVTQQEESSILCGHPFRNGQVITLGPGEVMDHTTCRGYHAYYAAVDEELLRTIGNSVHVDWIDNLNHRYVLSPPARGATKLETVIRRVIRFDQTGPSSRIQQEFLETLMALMCAPSQAEPNRLANRRSVVLGVEEYVEARWGKPTTIPEICAEFCVSERSLNYAFQEIRGMSPKAYFKARRLNEVRRALKQAEPAHGVIRAVMARWGFRHSGQFAADYLRQFGEHPSQTLTRKPLRVLASA